MHKLKLQTFFISTLFTLIFFSGCEDEYDSNDMLQTVADNAISLDLFDDLSRQANLHQYGNTANCPDVTLSLPEQADYPRGIIINYEESCIDPFNRERSGRIIINQSAAYAEEGMIREIVIENYKVDGIILNGQRREVCTGKNTQGYPIYSVKDSAGLLLLPDDKSIQYSAELTREWTGGSDSPTDFSDDVWRVTGQGKGNSIKGYNYDFEIYEAIFFDTRCTWKMTEGKIRLRSEGFQADADYGRGACDNAIIVLTKDTEETVYF